MNIKFLYKDVDVQISEFLKEFDNIDVNGYHLCSLAIATPGVHASRIIGSMNIKFLREKIIAADDTDVVIVSITDEMITNIPVRDNNYYPMETDINGYNAGSGTVKLKSPIFYILPSPQQIADEDFDAEKFLQHFENLVYAIRIKEMQYILQDFDSAIYTMGGHQDKYQIHESIVVLIDDYGNVDTNNIELIESKVSGIYVYNAKDYVEKTKEVESIDAEVIENDCEIKLAETVSDPTEHLSISNYFEEIKEGYFIQLRQADKNSIYYIKNMLINSVTFSSISVKNAFSSTDNRISIDKDDIEFLELYSVKLL